MGWVISTEKEETVPWMILRVPWADRGKGHSVILRNPLIWSSVASASCLMGKGERIQKFSIYEQLLYSRSQRW